MTPKKYQSGETDYTGRISKIGDASVREALYQAAHIMLTKPVKGCSHSRAGRCGSPGAPACSKAKVALARKLAVILHRMLADESTVQRRLPRQQPKQEDEPGFRAGHDTRLFPKRSPFAGTMDQVRPSPGLSTHLKM